MGCTTAVFLFMICFLPPPPVRRSQAIVTVLVARDLMDMTLLMHSAAGGSAAGFRTVLKALDRVLRHDAVSVRIDNEMAFFIFFFFVSEVIAAVFRSGPSRSIQSVLTILFPVHGFSSFLPHAAAHVVETTKPS